MWGGGMTMTSGTERAAPAREAGALPELRSVWWEGGMRARAEATIAAVLAELPKLVHTALKVSWRASRGRTAVIVGATLTAGAMATFGLLATQQVLVGLFSAGPTPDRVRRPCPRCSPSAP